MTGEQLAAEAEALVGTPFRLHGRDPANGLDCVGLLAAALAAGGRASSLPNFYPLRAGKPPELGEAPAACGFETTAGRILPGDVLLVRIGPCQFHLLIAAKQGRFIHAHAGLRRVIRCGGPLEWPVIHHWRLAASI